MTIETQTMLMVMPKKAYPPRWRRRGPGPLGPHGDTAERLAKHYAGIEAEPLPSEMEALLDRLDLAEAERRPRELEQRVSHVG